MWLITNFGFFSVVEKSNQKGSDMLTVRARVKSDLEALRDKYLPAMGAIEGDKGTDYKWRAVAPAAQVAAAFGKAIADIDYSNFKDSVAAKQGSKRSKLYHELWDTLWKLADEDKVAATTDIKPKSSVSAPAAATFAPGTAFGGVVFDDKGRILLRKPTNEYDNYVWTFPKGRPEKGESPEQAALREVREEGGVEAAILALIPGSFKGGTSSTIYYRMKVVKDHGDFDKSESEQVTWAKPKEAQQLILQTRNTIGQKRDLDVLKAAIASGAGQE